MSDEIVPIIIVPAFFFVIAYCIKVISDNRIKRLLISQNMGPEMVDKLFLQKPLPDSQSALKWGLIVASIGVAFCILQLMHFAADEPVSYGIVFLCGGAGLLAYYALSAKKADH